MTSSCVETSSIVLGNAQTLEHESPEHENTTVDDTHNKEYAML